MGSLLNGDEAHDVVTAHAAQLGMRHVLAERAEFGPGRTYRVDRFDKA